MILNSEVVHGFAGSMLSKRYDAATPTPQCHLEWWDLCCSDSKFVAIAAPRGHGKSTAITHAYVLAAALFRQRKFIILVSDTETQATNFLNDIKEELRNNDDLIELFGVKDFKKDTETDIIVELNDGYTFRIMVRGSEQRVRGLKWPQSNVTLRPDLIVCHQKGTDIFTPETGWIKNQEHPKARLIKAHEAFQIEFEDGTKEVISGDHRFWIENKGWMFPWELKPGMNVEEGFSENIIEFIERSIQNESKNQKRPIEILKRAKQNAKNGKQIIQIWLLLQGKNGTNKIKSWFMLRLKHLLKSTLNGKLLNVPKGEPQN